MRYTISLCITEIRLLYTHNPIEIKYRTNYLIFSIFCFSILFLLDPSKVLAESPPFKFEELTDPHLDWTDLNNKEQSTKGIPSTDILSVNYQSDGKILNSTFWLSGPINSNPKGYPVLNYGIYVDADFDKRTGYGGIDYKSEMSWNETSKTWTKVLEKWSRTGDTKTILKQNNYSGFFETGKNYVELPLDLGLLDYPSKYKITYYSEAKKRGNESLISDLTKWVAIPPLDLTITTMPSVIELLKGEEKTIEVRVNASQGYEPIVKLIDRRETKSIESVSFQNNTLQIPTYGIAATPLTIQASANSKAGPYTLILFANSTFPPDRLTDEIVTNNVSTFIPEISENIFARSITLVTIVDPPSWDENLKNFWDNIGGPTSFFYGILAGLAPWIYSSIKNRKNKK